MNERDAFEPQQLLLHGFTFRIATLADATRGINNALPGDRGTFRQRTQRISHTSCLTRYAGELCDLPVGRDASSRDAADHTMDGTVDGFHYQGYIFSRQPSQSLLFL